MSAESSNMSQGTSKQTKEQTEQQVDISIVGGGLSGLLMAVSLLKQPNIPQHSKLAIIEAAKLEPSQINPFDDRVLALSHGSVEYLRSLGVWTLMADDANPIETIHISDRGNYGKARIKATDHQVEALGYVIPLASIANGLLAALKTADEHNKPIQWYTDSQIEQLTIKAEHSNIKLAAGAQAEPIDIEAKLVIACDGGQSLCRKVAKIGTSQQDYGQWAVIANVCPELPHNNRAFERFTEHGPIAMLPMTNQQCSLVWTLPPEQAQQISELDDKAFCLALEQAFGRWLGSIQSTSKRSIFPLSLVQAEQQSYHRMALVGNASHTIHPIAGQGFNLGLRDVKVLADLVQQQIASGEADLGNAKLLNQYQVMRESDQQAIIKLTDSMVTLFSNDLPPLLAGRNIGLKVMNYLSPLQKAFVNKTMGY
ncbi:2-octaprenyl-6-methoxyphenyl hydroxylase [Thalassotalea euphylliae]|nr:2-octaprenyl-6-methoxyphenyl hydroxylase [Thalassotalea euphylliae]